MKKQSKPASSEKKPAPSARKSIPSRENSRPFPIAGIGASAGGLEALEQFRLKSLLEAGD